MKSAKFAAIGAAALLIAVPALLTAQQAKTAVPKAKGEAPSHTPADLKKDASYGIGLAFAKNIKEQAIDLDIDQLIQGVRDGMAGGKARLSDAELETVMQEFRDSLVAQQQAKKRVAGDKNKKEGAAYLAENQKKPGVKVTSKGVQIETIKEGTGAAPKPTDTVKVHYKGTLIDGTEFDSSYKRGEPISFPLNRVIAGWTDGVQQIKVGGKSRLVIPAELAYGEEGSPPTIPPNSTLVFEIELLGIETK
jgi:FKBP-type peptidyl-prolyl cis-trans isomerase